MAMKHSFGNLLILEIIFIIFLSILAYTDSSVSPNRCDTTTRETFRTNCINCWQNRKVSCPGASRKQTRGAGNRGCRYDVRVGGSTMSAKGCTHTCGHAVTVSRCCDGYWGEQCNTCPVDSSNTTCGGKGSCFDGIEGNGTCACQGNLAGAFCEKCSQPQFYGPTCQSVCACVHGACDSGINGTGSCFCENGFGGRFCEKALEACSTLNCHPNSSCLNRTGEVRCHCNKGYSGSGITCEEINPCITGTNKPCHSQASCVHTGPDESICSCNDGYSGDGYWCVPIDPCQTNSGGCPSDSTVCRFDGPAMSHCECLTGFENFTAGAGCALKDICGLYNDSTCDPLATCQTVVEYDVITVNCTCPPGFVENERICYADLLTELGKLNQTGTYQNKLNLAIAFFKTTYKELLFTPNPWTLLVPVDEAFPPSLMNNISSDPIWKATARAHIISGLITINFTEDSAKTMYPLLGVDYSIKALRPVPSDDDDVDDDSEGYFATIKFGGKSRGKILEDAKYALNGLMYIVDILLDIPDKQYFVSDVGVMGTIEKTPGLGGFSDIISQSFVFRRKLLETPSYSLFVPTSEAFSLLSNEEYKYLTSPMGLSSLDILLQYHQFTGPTSMLAITMVERINNIGVISVNVTQNGIVTLGREQAKIKMSEISVKGGNIFIYLIDKILIPDLLRPLVTNRCNSTKTVQKRGPCGHCGRKLCPPGGIPDPNAVSKTLVCVYGAEVELGDQGAPYLTTRHGCSRMCLVNVTTTSCCIGFYGAECRSCPGPTHQACNDHGVCFDSEAGTGLCSCNDGFKGRDCSKCVNETMYGPGCDQECLCRNGTCKNSIYSHGECLPGTCADGWSGEMCDRPLRQCRSGALVCHQFASCVVSDNGTESCVCDSGYTGSGEFCYDYNPCQGANWGGCDVNAYCLHLGAGNTACECPPNYAGDGYNCTAVDPCASVSKGNCSKNGICIFTGPGENRCECKTGYRGDGKLCTEINICEEMNGGCHRRAMCTPDGPGSGTCKCFEGYDGDGFMCTGNVLQEISLQSELSSINQWILKWPEIRQIFIDLGPDFTCFLPDNSAWEMLTSSQTEFWIDEAHFPYLVKNHIVPSKLLSSNLKTLAGNSVQTMLEGVNINVNKLTVDTSDTNVADGFTQKSTLPTLQNGNDYAKIMLSDLPVSKGGIIHVIDSVLIPPRDVVKDYPALSAIMKNTTGTNLGQFKKFLALLVTSGIIDQIEETHISSSYTLFVAPDSASNFPPSNATGQEIADTLRYHVISGEMIRAGDIQSGKHYNTLLGSGYQVSLVRRHGKIIVNGQKVLVADIRTSRGIIHGLSYKLLQPVKTRCDGTSTNYIETTCLPCSYPNHCPVSSNLRSKALCLYSHSTNGQMKTLVGCQLICAKSMVQPRCCSGFYGSGCEPCPGGVGNVCFGLGTCSDGMKGNGSCTCTDSKHSGLGCETCSSGRYGKQCELTCSCVNGTCNDGINGDGTCFCNQGYRGALCDAPVDLNDTCQGKCHFAAECVPSSVGSGGTCRCLAGFRLDGDSCTAIDPCKTQQIQCGVNATCNYKSPGISECKCDENYEGDGIYCREINPCVHGFDSKCHDEAYCVHTGPNEANCICNANYEGDGKQCSEIDPCQTNNGGCSIDAICRKLGPAERECKCLDDFVGNGINCTGSIYTFIAGRSGYEWFNLMDSVGSQVPHAFSSLGPLIVFLPPHAEIMKLSSTLRSSKELSTQVYLNHIVGCASAPSLDNVTKLRTLAGDVIDVSQTDNGYKLNGDISVQDGPFEYWNGIVYLINKPLMPSYIKHLNTTSTAKRKFIDILSAFLNPYVVNTSDTTSAMDQNTKMLLSKGFTWVSSVLNKSGDLYLLQEEIHQKWTLFFPTDEAFNTMPAQKLRLLVNDPSYASEYIRYHMIRQSFSTPINIAPKETLKTMQGSDVTLSCKASSDVMGEITVNGGMATVTGFRVFPVRTANIIQPAAVYVIDKVLEPPSIGGRCDIIQNTTINTECRLCFGRYDDCPEGTTQVARTECRASVFPQNTVTITGCQLKCAAFNVTHKCCKNYYSSDCHPCPGGALKPCSGNGECSDGLKGTGDCKCKEGFAGYACERCTATRYGRNCLPCKCTVHGTCNEGITGDGACYCDSGWTGTTCEQSTNSTLCNPPCHTNGYCVKSGTCFCKPGYRGDGVDVCEFMDMCRVNNGGCSPYATCSLGQNKVICKCRPNFVGDGYYCEGYDPCIASKTGCHAQARCVYVGANTSRCECNEGYHGDGIRMCLRTQYTNCATNNGGCSGHAACTDVPPSLTGGYPTTSCKCLDGYVGDGYVCHGNVLQVISESVEMMEFYKQLRRQLPRVRRRLTTPGANITMFAPADMKGHGKYRAMPAFAIARHFVAGKMYYYKDLLTMKALNMKSGDILPVVTNGSNALFVNGVRVRKYDIIATNGVVHLMDSFLTKRIIILPTGPPIVFTPVTTKKSSASSLTKKTMVKPTKKSATTAIVTVKRGPIDGGGAVTTTGSGSVTKGADNTATSQPSNSGSPRMPDAASRLRRSNGIKIGVSVLIIAMILIAAGLIYWWKNRHSYVFRPFTERQRLTSSSDPTEEDNYGGMTNPAYDSTGFNTVDDEDVILTEADVDVAEAMKTDEGPFTFENPGTS